MSDNKICFDILAFRQNVQHFYQNLFLPVLKKYRLTQMEADIILFLANNPMYDTASEIISIRKLTKSHVSSSIDQLVKKGFLSRSYEAGNKKKIHLKLLPDAFPIIEEGRKCQQEFWNILSVGIPSSYWEIACSVFKQIMDNIKNYKGGPEHVN